MKRVLIVSIILTIVLSLALLAIQPQEVAYCNPAYEPCNHPRKWTPIIRRPFTPQPRKMPPVWVS